MISVIDYGMGNLRSVVNAFQFWHSKVELITTAEEIKKASKLVLPGVGSFHEVMKAITQSGIISALNQAVLEDKKPVLGICLGMQMMAHSGTEGGQTKGLGWIEGTVEPLFEEEKTELGVPHVGFSDVQNLLPANYSMFTDGIDKDFYFCHSYHLVSDDKNLIAGKSHYGKSFISAIQKDNIWGTQFHPEKSQSNGLRLIKQFIDWQGEK